MLKYFKHKKAIMKKVLYVLHQKTSVAGDVGNKFKNRGFNADIIIWDFAQRREFQRLSLHKVLFLFGFLIVFLVFCSSV